MGIGTMTKLMERIRKDTSQSRDRYITYEELKKHSGYSDAWISINGIVYDITRFIHKHPFGDTFRGNLGTECGGMFSSAHLNTNVEKRLESDEFLIRNNIIIVGRLNVSRDHLHKESDDSLLDRIVYKETYNDAFWLELKDKVTSYLRDKNETVHYTFREGLYYIIYYSVIYLLLSYLTWIEGSAIASILLGIHMICALSNISHMATHYGFTRSPLLNAIAMHFFDISGMSGLYWYTSS
jgi:cytochrome b involved in lipid metabolism